MWNLVIATSYDQSALKSRLNRHRLAPLSCPGANVEQTHSGSRPPGCRVGAELELRCGAIIERLSVTTCVLADLAGASKPDAFWSLKGECEVLRKDIRDLREQIASHRSEHHC